MEHLQTLFTQLTHTDQPSIRPELELAYLALVTTQDEEEKQKLDKFEAEKHQKEKESAPPPESMEVDENTPMRCSLTGPLASTSSKNQQISDIDQVKPTDLQDKPDTSIESTEKEDFVMVERPSKEIETVSTENISIDEPKKVKVSTAATTVEGPPPLPPRKKVEEKRTPASGEMMFGPLSSWRCTSLLLQPYVQASNTMFPSVWTTWYSRSKLP